MTAPGRARRLVAALSLALLLLTMDAAVDGARNATAAASLDADDRSASGDGSSEAGVASSALGSGSASDSASGSASSSASSSDGPGEVHAASFSDSGSHASSWSSSWSSSSSGTSTSTSASAATDKSWPVPFTSAADWAMTSVTVVHARVQADAPEWDAERRTFVSMYGDSFRDKFRAALDTANTASVEGALMYVQAEGINAREQSVACERKNNMQYVVFYALQIMQTRNAVALYQSSAPTIEYCPFVAMDSGRCTPTSGDMVFPDECYQFHGRQGEPDIGPCVGGEAKDTDFRAPYPDTYWFSLPGSCPLEERADKTDACRQAYPGGLCDYGEAPDGDKCTFTYRILGYISIDDLVGITRVKDKASGEYYANYSQFCQAGGVEFSAVVDEAGETVQVNKSLAFWADPTNSSANARRAQLMVERYAELVEADAGGRMVALPSVDALTASNPPCYLNNVQCASATHGCRRRGYFQVCQVCSSADEDGCVVAPEDFSFPDLRVVDDSASASGSGSESSSAAMSATKTAAGEDNSAERGSSEELESEAESESDESASSGAVSSAQPAGATLLWLVLGSTSVWTAVAAL